jgi:hypothetical protein
VSRIVRAVSAEDFSGASGIDPLPDGRSGAGLYAIEQASRIRRNARLIKNERKNARTITTRVSPLIARRSGVNRKIDQHVAG